MSSAAAVHHGLVPVLNLRKAHDVPVLGVLTKGTESLVSSLLSTAASAFDTPSDTELMDVQKTCHTQQGTQGPHEGSANLDSEWTCKCTGM